MRWAFDYLISLPERSIRSAAAGVGGFLYEITLVVLPGWFRRSNLYQAIVARTLRVVIELVGDAKGILPPDDVQAGEMAKRKAAGTIIEFAGFLTIGWSPLWIFAITADLTGGSRTYLKELVSEFKRDGLLAQDTDVNSADELLVELEESSGLMAEMLDMPPLNLADMRATWQELRSSVTELPDASRLTRIYALMEQVAKQEERSLWSISSLIAAGAARAGAQVGKVHIFDFYDRSLRTITAEGYYSYALRVIKPYRLVASSHFDPERITYTERALRRLRRKKRD